MTSLGWINSLSREDLGVAFEALIFRIEAETSIDDLNRKYYAEKLKQYLATSTSSVILANRIMSIPVNELQEARVAMWSRLPEVVTGEGSEDDTAKPPTMQPYPHQHEFFVAYGPPPARDEL